MMIILSLVLPFFLNTIVVKSVLGGVGLIMILRSNSCNHTNWCWSRDISISRSWNNHCSYSGFGIFSVHNGHICCACWSFNEWSYRFFVWSVYNFVEAFNQRIFMNKIMFVFSCFLILSSCGCKTNTLCCDQCQLQSCNCHNDKVCVCKENCLCSH